ncbi:tyrosine-type recombinase/integrase [Acidiphilium sp. JA12-A1]|uniref:tyrosine-type recombinase/integrase n=1 Tax=Acidiphilium sp. JA12-A1 TaxID=1464546 RepID=UPI0009E6AD80
MSYVRKHSKTGIYWYRRAVPPRLREHMPPISGFPARVRTEITKSLETRDLRAANRLAGDIDRRVQRALDQAQTALNGGAHEMLPQSAPTTAGSSSAVYTRRQLQDAIEAWRRQEIARVETEILNSPLLDNPAEVAMNEKFANADRNFALCEGRCENVPGFYEAMSAALAQQGVNIAVDHPALRRLDKSFASAWHDTITAREYYILGLPYPAAETSADTVGISPGTTPMKQSMADDRASKPFLLALNDWEREMPYRGKQISTYLSDVRSYAAVIAEGPISAVDFDSVQRWVAEIQTSLSAKTAKRKLSALRSYWNYLQHKGLMPRGEFPGRGVTILRTRTAPEDKRRSFAPDDVVRLWRMAESNGDVHLANAIRLAAYTGARIESLFQMRVADFGETDGILFVRFSDKTDAGVRSVPIHSAIRPMVERLRASPLPDGYLLSGAINRHGERSAAVGKRFGHLRTKAGFGPQYVFHSIRKTVTSMLRVADVEEADAAQLLGHEYRGITYGTYAGDLAVPNLSAIIERHLTYPDAL